MVSLSIALHAETLQKQQQQKPKTKQTNKQTGSWYSVSTKCIKQGIMFGMYMCVCVCVVCVCVSKLIKLLQVSASVVVCSVCSGV